MMSLVSFEFPHALTGKLQSVVRRLLGLLGEAMKRHQAAFRETEKDARYSIAGEVAPDFSKPVA
jgi:hypothetical protein